MSDVVFREARAADVAVIVGMLADDPLGAAREAPGELGPYLEAFDRIVEDPNQVLVVVERDGRVVGSMQLTIIPGLSRQGASRALIEAVRVQAGERGDGLGSRLIGWAVDEARRRGCRMVQLTSDASRTDAHRFYTRLGFTASHVGFKLALG